ncbi:SubName: Full=Uncharacterized protein {ECO:0000313/EMBL:CCA77771.1} [Serendipita indica DSM 11827]|nr:SubName: Full=Uncharacterized protein {ECO:0000313/EMBL:CCA77771.1} [Serendipita indica DSM 11827]
MNEDSLDQSPPVQHQQGNLDELNRNHEHHHDSYGDDNRSNLASPTAASTTVLNSHVFMHSSNPSSPLPVVQPSPTTTQSLANEMGPPSTSDTAQFDPAELAALAQAAQLAALAPFQVARLAELATIAQSVVDNAHSTPQGKESNQLTRAT